MAAVALAKYAEALRISNDGSISTADAYYSPTVITSKCSTSEYTHDYYILMRY